MSSSDEKKRSLKDTVIKLDYDLSWRFALLCKLDRKSWSFLLLDKTMKVFEILGSGVPTLTFSILILPFTSYFRFYLSLSVAQILDIIAQFTVKNIFKRQRPTYQDNSDMFFTHGPDVFSFPSGHCARMTMFWYLTSCMMDVESTQYRILAVIYGIITISRVFMGRHYISDLVGGMVLGLLTGMFAWHVTWLH